VTPEAAYGDPEVARRVLETYKIIAVVGISPDPSRPSHGVARYLQSRGYTIVPVRPGADEILGEKAYDTLEDIPASVGVEVVDVFRRSEFAPAHAKEAVAIGAKALWMQDGVVSPEAAKLASDAGLDVVMDRCMARDHSTMFSR
jgi:predicted CoA-binding protein